mmetsp:Transcript_3754/g.8279  ORF Transcript_3754/g.8279 Transcript_3754/m.8279 type:complete len:243 (-) Transcript_3754:340-1068(-)
MNASSSSHLLWNFTAIAATLPTALYVRDNLFSLYRVQGSSMEPNLTDGDVLLVRKADFYPRRQWEQWSSPATSYEEEVANQNAIRVMANDANSGRPIGDELVGNTFLHPPMIHQLGSVVVFRAPDARRYPSSEYRVKRVIGLGGQIVRASDSIHRVERVPPFALWVEGDNHGVDATTANDTAKSTGGGNDAQTTTYKSIDSRSYGPISKNLLIGVAELVVWPPTRWGSVPCIYSPDPQSWWE